ncbi:MAG: hypothetical protein CVU05_05985 [Bacteroidetes bacterium HGW-Bacteroidetes-21]|nr:MAG: hypothetical protein CVU05_05985 [Bacteroidetes bacterium HGW-Bacteroidetes-21]
MVEKSKYVFNQKVEELFPNQNTNIIFAPISVKRLNLIDDEFRNIETLLLEQQIETIKFKEKPYKVSINEELQIDASFLSSKQGSFSTWVKLKSVNEYYKNMMNFEYLISHATNNYLPKNNKYQNVFSIALVPNVSNKSGKLPTEIRWVFWISNDKWESSFIKGPVLSNNEEMWYHILIRWDHDKPQVDFLIDGQIIDSRKDYFSFWPTNFLKSAFIGTWGNRQPIHYIKRPLFRFFTSSIYLNNEWVEIELKNKPKF